MTDEEWEATFVTPYLPEYPEIGICDDPAPGWGPFIAYWVVVLAVIAVVVVAVAR